MCCLSMGGGGECSLVLLVFYGSFVFLSFFDFNVFYFFVVDKGVSLAPTYPQLR